MGKGDRQFSAGLTYVAQKPAFLANFGQPTPAPSDRASGSSSRGGRGGDSGREPLPERPRDGRWAGGSDDEGKAGEAGEDDEDEDEWSQMYGGDDGPQIVVLKEGRHLTADDLKRERRRAAGKPSESPPPASTAPASTSTAPAPPSSTSTPPTGQGSTKLNPTIPRPNAASAKRKLVGGSADEVGEGEGKKDKEKGKGGSKKKKVATKGLLSFDEAEGDS